MWTITYGEAARILENHDYGVNPGFKLSSGLFFIGHRRNWLYSKKLFPQPIQLESAIRRMLRNVSEK